MKLYQHVAENLLMILCNSLMTAWSWFHDIWRIAVLEWWLTWSLTWDCRSHFVAWLPGGWTKGLWSPSLDLPLRLIYFHVVHNDGPSPFMVPLHTVQPTWGSSWGSLIEGVQVHIFACWYWCVSLYIQYLLSLHSSSLQVSIMLCLEFRLYC